VKSQERKNNGREEEPMHGIEEAFLLILHFHHCGKDIHRKKKKKKRKSD
jgi:hypothetical protein